MSKTRNKSHSELEHLRGQLKKLESINRSLRKRNKQLERAQYLQDSCNEEDEIEVKVENNCPNCKKGHLKVIDLNTFVITTCDFCNYRKRTKCVI